MGEQDLTSLVSVFDDFFTSIYKNEINRVLASYPTSRSINVDFQELDRFNPSVADRLLSEPEIVREAAEEAIRTMNLTLPPGVGEFSPHVRFYNGPDADVMIEQLSSKKLNQLVSFKGIITKRTDVMHKVKKAHYTCQACGETYDVVVGRNFKPPRMCSSCKKLALVPNEEKSDFVDMQKAEVQDLLEKVSGGAPAAKMELWFEDDVVNNVNPGENVQITGIMRIKPSQNTKQKNELVFNRYVDVMHVDSLKRDFEEINLTKEDIARIREAARHENITKRIFSSIAPAVYGYDEVKKALALQLFGGTGGKRMRGDALVRDDIHVLLIGDPGIAKCTEGDSEVMLADGSLKKIREVVEEALAKNPQEKVEDGSYAISNHDVLSLNLDAKLDSSKATKFWKLEAPPSLYEVETGTGKKIRVTPEHPFFLSSDGHIFSKPAKELKKGEFISTPRKIPVRGKLQRLPVPRKGRKNAKSTSLPNHLDKRFARLLGYLAGDGYFRRGTSYEISLTNNDQELLDDFNSILSSYNLTTKLRRDRRTGATTSFAFSVELGEVLSKLGIEGKTARTKTVPELVLKSPDSIVAEFIKAYFDCDATVGPEGITLVSASRQMAARIQLLLLRFGIISQLHKTFSRATNTRARTRRKYYRLFILGENARRYGKCIGFTCKHKKRKLQDFRKKSNPNLDVIPNISGILKETRKLLGLSQFQCGIPRTTYQHFERGDRNPSPQTLYRIVSAFKKHDKAHKNIRLLELLSESHVFWDRVLQVRKVRPKEKWVYDLQVDPTHNFLANGMVVHNTRIMNSAVDLAPKSMYVSGKSVSGVGLTASAEKDELGDGGWTLKAGALVLASGGIGAIDEFDKIDDEDRSSLHEVMESATVSIAKAGIVAKFKAKTSIVAAANPKHGRFNQTKNLADQFDVPPSLLSRFDLLFPIMDVLDEEKDLNLAEHILSSHIDAARGTVQEEEDSLDRDFLRKYIAYARRNIRPVLSDSAKDKIKEFYLDLRRRGKSSGSVPITPRYLEGLVRLAEAHAKMRLSQMVELEDAKVAIDLLDYVLKKVLTDQETGRFDVDIITTGRPRSQVEKIESILDIIKEKTVEQEAVSKQEVLEEAEASGLDAATAKRILSELQRKGDIYEKEPGWIAIVGNK